MERLHLDFVRSGARFDAASQGRYSEIMEKLAELETVFTQVWMYLLLAALRRRKPRGWAL